MSSFRIAAQCAVALALATCAFAQAPVDASGDARSHVGEIVAAGNLDELERVVRSGLPPDTGLVAAARKDSGPAMRLLLELGADAHGLQASRALFYAHRLGHAEPARVLSEAGASLEGADATGRTLLILTVEEDRPRRLKEVLAAGAEIERATSTGMTALMTAVATGQPPKVRMLLERGADANSVDRDGWTALSWAVRRADLDSVLLLLARGADPNQEDRLGWTPLHLAAAQGSAEIAHKLLAWGARPNHATATAGTALIRALMSGDADTVRLLLAFGAKRWDRFGGRSPLGWARALGRRELAETLRARGRIR